MHNSTEKLMQQDQLRNNLRVPLTHAASSSEAIEISNSYQHSLVVWLYYGSYSILRASYSLVRLLNVSHTFFRGFFLGIWLGLLRHETLLKINNIYYSKTKRYKDPNYNKGGLWTWESAIIARYFCNCKRLLLIGAGGGREVIALRRLGYDVDGCECNSDLVQVANAFLEQEGLSPNIQFAPPDICPTVKGAGPLYHGLIVGWGAYMLIQGRDNRVALLRKMRSHVNAGAPLLVSFFFRSPDARQFLITKAAGNTLRRLLRRKNIELGDALEPEYVHYFTQEEITGELHDAGFMLDYYTEVPYGHAVGIAS